METAETLDIMLARADELRTQMMKRRELPYSGDTDKGKLYLEGALADVDGLINSLKLAAYEYDHKWDNAE